jgi:Porin subfamily
MKLVKSVLLGSAVGFVAVAAAHAADLPLKAKPVEYVKVCSLYGAGYWYVPGTDTCIKLGGLMRFQMEWNANAGGVPLSQGGAVTGGRETRADTNELAYRSRVGISMDLRTQTEYGTLRSYLRGGFQITSPNDNGTANVYWDRGFLQFMGFTAGLAQSFFDILSYAPYGYANARILGGTGAVGINLFAYTMQLGNGLSFTLSLEDGGGNSAGTGSGGVTARDHLTINASATAFGLGSTTYDNAGNRFWDTVGALNLDQTWGSALIAVAAHDASGGYYGSTAALSTTAGHPDTKWGWAATGGFTLSNFLGMKGDSFGFQATFSEGAAGYATRNIGAWQLYGSGNNAAMGWLVEGVFRGTGTATDPFTSTQLTKVWDIGAIYEHLWNVHWRTSLYGGFSTVDYGAAATAMICASTTSSGAAVASPSVFGGAITLGSPGQCNPDFSWFWIGSRTQWNPHPDIDIGVDVAYTGLNTAFGGGLAALPANGARPAGTYTIQNQGIWTVMMRWQRNFIP